jgi:hypothetical protein
MHQAHAIEGHCTDNRLHDLCDMYESSNSDDDSGRSMYVTEAQDIAISVLYIYYIMSRIEQNI